jgi:hypothetical protein
MNQFTCKGVKQINNRISLKIDIHLYHSYLSAFFVKAGVPNGEFPEILIAKCRSRIFGTWFFSQAEDFGSWREGRKGSSKSGEKCSRRKVHMYDVQGLKFSSPGLFVDASPTDSSTSPSLEKTSVFTLENYVWSSRILHFFWLLLFCDDRQVLAVSICYLLIWKIVSDFADSWSVDFQYFQV